MQGRKRPDATSSTEAPYRRLLEKCRAQRRPGHPRNRSKERPDYKDQVRSVCSGPRATAGAQSTGQMLQDRSQDPITPQIVNPAHVDEEIVTAPLEEGPRYKDQVRTAARSPALRVSPNHHDPSQTSLSSHSEPPRDPTLITAVLVDEPVVIEADPVVAENKRRKRIALSVLLLVALVFGAVAGICGGGACSGGGGGVDGGTVLYNMGDDLSDICALDFSVECYVAPPGEYILLCTDALPSIDPVGPCFYRPFEATLLFNGGPCSQSDNVQELNFTCTDFNGGPPLNEGDQAHILVSDNGEDGPILFDGNVTVGDTFGLSNNGTVFGDTQLITVSTPNQTAVLQVVEGVSFTCSHPLELVNRYGACQVIEYENEVQGLVSSFATYSNALEIQIHLSVQLADRQSRQRYTLTSVTLNSTLTGPIDITHEYESLEVNAESDAEIILEGVIDMSERETYVTEIYVEALASPGNKTCNATGVADFLAGFR